MQLTSLSSRLAIPLSASSLDSSNFSKARVISSSVMLLPVRDRRVREREGKKMEEEGGGGEG